MHDPSALINTYSQEGFPIDCGEDWKVEHIDAELRQGPHPSADAEDDYTREKVSNGYAKVIRYGDLKKKFRQS